MKMKTGKQCETKVITFHQTYRNTCFKGDIDTMVAQKEENCRIISVKDNNDGFSREVLDKIYRLFISANTAGQDTRQGLSLSYDIITKEHSGALKANSTAGEGTIFTIVLTAAGNESNQAQV